MQTKIINIIGEEAHTLVMVRIERTSLPDYAESLFEETKIDTPVISIMTLVAGPYTGTQLANMEGFCLEEMRDVYAFLRTDEGWNSVETGDRIDTAGNKFPRLS